MPYRVAHAGMRARARAVELPVAGVGNRPGRASETFRVVAANLPFAASLSQELRVRRDGRLVAESVSLSVFLTADVRPPGLAAGGDG